LELFLGGYRIKICGITNLADLEAAAAAGADFAGVLLEVGSSPRSLSFFEARFLVQALPFPVLILTDRNDFEWLYSIGTEISPYGLQLLGKCDPGLIRQLQKTFPACAIWQSFHLPPAGISDPDFSLSALASEMILAFQAGVQAAVLDTAVRRENTWQRGGTGLKHNWELAQVLVAKAPGPVFLAGGINPDNVQAALNLVNPAGVDLSSGVEVSPGKKDFFKMQHLVERVRACGG